MLTLENVFNEVTVALSKQKKFSLHYPWWPRKSNRSPRSHSMDLQRPTIVHTITVYWAPLSLLVLLHSVNFGIKETTFGRLMVATSHGSKLGTELWCSICSAFPLSSNLLNLSEPIKTSSMPQSCKPKNKKILLVIHRDKQKWTLWGADAGQDFQE